MQTALSTNSTNGYGRFLLGEVAAEREEILRHKRLESQGANGDIGFKKAFLNWMAKHRVAWRASRLAPAVKQRMAADGERKSILVVDDEEAIRELLAGALEDAGYHAEWAENGIEGLHRFRESQWDAVITDRSMPEMDGEELATRIRAESPSTPIVLVSGMASQVADPNLFDAIVSKPFRMAGILATLHTILSGQSV